MRFSVQEVEVGPFLVDLTTGRIQREGIELALRPQAFRVLKSLLQNRGQYVDYEHMIADAWAGTVVSRHTVDVTVGEAKKALQEFAHWITHRPKLGYKLEVPKSEDLVRKGWHFWNRRTREGFEKAIASFEEAASEDSSDFRAFEGLAASYMMLGTYSMKPPAAVYEAFVEAHDRAVALSGMTPELRTQRAHVLHVFERKLAEAESEFLKAVREKPTMPKAYQYLAMLYTAMARPADALQALERSRKLDPLWPVLPATEVAVRFYDRDFEAAVECGRKAIELHPYIQVGRAFYAQALEYSGRIDEALKEYHVAATMSGMNWQAILEAICLAKNGRTREAVSILNGIEKERATEHVDAYHMALLYYAFGKADRAFQELEKALEECSSQLCLMNVDPKLDDMRKDRRFSLLDLSQKSTVRV